LFVRLFAFLAQGFSYLPFSNETPALFKGILLRLDTFR
jgi:hypothetical protein